MKTFIKKIGVLSLQLLILLTTKSISAQCTSSFNYTIGSNGTVYFNSTSLGTNSSTIYNWNFGNSTSISGTNNISATAIYTANGTYAVNLFLFTAPSCSVNSTQTITISNVTSTCNVLSNFSYSLGSNGLTNFTNSSINTNSTSTYFWDFGNGTNSTSLNPSLTYTVNGSYYVCLTVNNGSACADNFCQNVVISNSTNTCNIVAGYTCYSGTNGLMTFTNSSANTTSATTYFWNFGNGITSTLISPTITYTANGIYNVCLTAYNGGTVCSNTSCNNYTVSNVLTSGTCSLSANYSQTISSNGLVSFSNTSIGTNTSSTYYWDFGDGYTSSGITASHTYSVNGTYSVTLIVNNTNMASCISTLTQTLTVNNSVGGCVANSGFNMAPTSTVSGNWTATPVFPWNVIGASWNWGDGSSSNSLYTSHQYSASGTYSICLTVTVSCGLTSSTCSNYFIYKSSNTMIFVNVAPPNIIPTNLSNTAIEAYNFDIYPNPNNGQFSIKTINEPKNEILKISVYNLIGEIVYQSNINNTDVTKSIKLDAIPNGIYFVKVKNGNQEFSKKIIVTK